MEWVRLVHLLDFGSRRGSSGRLAAAEVGHGRRASACTAAALLVELSRSRRTHAINARNQYQNNCQLAWMLKPVVARR